MSGASAEQVGKVLRDGWILPPGAAPVDRLLVAGWGESHPAVPNSASGNTPQNRRVEIYFRPESVAGGTTVTSSEADTQASPARPLDPVK